jgi:23S rRNA (cytidine1920-2'-O)/16S rRNA (cytidine1409-2'-O)-methyltransferase
MARRNRLDVELVRRGLARSREHAAELVETGRVELRGTRAAKPAAMVDPAEPLRVIDLGGVQYVSRGGHKLAGALAAFAGSAVAGRPIAGPVATGAGIAIPESADPGVAGTSSTGPRIAGRRCLDAGASTGGFTEVLLDHGAAHVVAVDVGYGQLAFRLRNDSRVSVLERTNVRILGPEQIGGRVGLTVADLSFISLRIILKNLVECTEPDGDIVPMVKPQFEVGRDRVGAGGVVRDPALRAEAVLDVARAAENFGLGVVGVVASPLPGPSGNVEFFLWLRADAPPVDPDLVHHVVGGAR